MTLQPMESASPDRRKGTEIRIALSRDEASSQSAARGGIELPGTPESFAIFRVPEEDVDRLYVYGADMRGLIYALTELADRVRYGANVLTELEFAAPLLETPTAKVRSISKCFVSEIEDLPWFHDREGWEDYLTALATHRFNRFSLTFGMQYNYPYGNEFMSDVYLHLAYPFLVSVPGYAVSISNLSEEERRQNLETLQFIGCEANRRGLDFQLALWTQSYDFDDCPNAKHQIAGLGPDNIALYCRDALALLLKEVPQISGLTLRVHVECGIPEGDYDFWRIYFEAVKGAGRPIRLDLHAKGIDDEMIDVALATGMPVGISPKYTSEHLGLPYHQTSIRALEMPPRDDMPAAAGRDMTTLYSGEDAERHARKWRFSEGSRKFMRYSYGDLLRENRPYAIMFRIWPGTTRILLWGDPALAGGYGRNATFCGAEGIELCEPLSFKGRMGTGIAGSRTGYRGKYRLFRHDWQKFEYTYRVWGRSLFDPEADPQVFRRFLVSKYGEAGDTCGRALASASRILPLITLAHTPTASNNSYWPEMYENMSLVHAAPQLPYGYELPRPSRFGTVGSCDPQLFMSPAEFASCLHEDRGVDRIAPLTWANWLERLALEASTKMAHALSASGDPGDELFLVSVDVTILASIGRFFAAKVRAATFWEYFLLSGDEDSARLALDHYRRARNAWAEAAKVCRDVYLPDSTYGPHSWLRGRWDDRLPAIERDIADMEAMISQSAQRPASEPDMHHLQRIGDWQASQVFGCRHTPPEGFAHGEAVEISLIPPGESHQEIILHYRHVDQSQPWCRIAMTWQDGAYRAIIPAGYTDAPFPLQYYFEIRDSDVSSFHPGLGGDVSATPYFVLEGRRA
ncbi:MAG: hypothetical protein LJE67_05690 [Salaquimonas sp.]|nr:hypothetical protein [Salaquimonas sp.]